MANSDGSSTINVNTMVQLAINPPRSLLFGPNVVNNWKLWKKQFHFYVTVTNFTNNSPEVQVATFITLLGPDAIAVFEGFGLSAVDQKKMEVIVEKFDN